MSKVTIAHAIQITNRLRQAGAPLADIREGEIHEEIRKIADVMIKIGPASIELLVLMGSNRDSIMFIMAELMHMGLIEEIPMHMRLLAKESSDSLIELNNPKRVTFPGVFDAEFAEC